MHNCRSARERDIDINRTVFFTPTIAEDDPLRRHYHLMRRYQPSLFSVFRRAPLATALRQARSTVGAMFQEVMFMNAMVLQGEMARLPHVLSLETAEVSFHLPQRNNPLYWFLDDARSFMRHYFRYRNALARFIDEHSIPAPPAVELGQLLDTIHAISRISASSCVDLATWPNICLSLCGAHMYAPLAPKDPAMIPVCTRASRLSVRVAGAPFV
jgi:hypothetical protein